MAGLVRIDKFDADPPAELYSTASTTEALYPANTVIEYPVKDLFFERSEITGITGSGSFSYSIVYRYPGDLTLNELPLLKLEGLVQYLQAQALLSLSGCGGIRRAVPGTSNEFPVQIERDGTDQGDWLVYANLVFNVEFVLTEFGLDPAFGPTPELPPDLNELTIGVYRAKTDFDVGEPNDSTLDATLTVDLST
ncbi:hypothetical protein IQ273_12865 [Nodosilinea sp. LEGE 07298]|uniref:hypothetical protein n=1 Tax=Nodosilinea sp. LEGE 07298 TaxID=2777970 RepID=UPI00187E3C80|nr:hypothetical protein [Nodosilinea sp. LEGE 07298]MBE9110304.1 hypothetical protein [Nodosilinea sp. LEGE 07298]